MRCTGLAALATLVLGGCSQIFGLDVPTVSSGFPEDAPSNTVTIGGQVSGLGGASGLVLQNNGGDDKPITSDGNYVFPTPIARGGSYDVTVSVQPTNPSELCTVANGSGVADTDIGGVVVTCGPVTYGIGGTVVGLTGSVMLHNAADTITITSNGTFMFPTKVQSGQTYSVTASGNSECVVFGGTGTVGNGDVTAIVVNCGGAGGPYSIGGTVSGLNGTVVLKNTVNGDNISLNSNGTYAFAMPIPSAGPYNVTVQQQPAYPPATQNCVVANGSGNAGGNIQNINVTCTTLSFTVGGGIAGLTGTLVLQDNGVDDMTTTTNGPYTFATALRSGTPYSVTIASQPASEVCTLTSASGTVKTANVTNVNATCMDPGTRCGNTFCMSYVCCNFNTAPQCEPSNVCTGGGLKCDDKADCSAGDECCADLNASQTKVVSSACSSTCGAGHVVLCDPGAPTSCGSGTACKPLTILPGYSACQ